MMSDTGVPDLVAYLLRTGDDRLVLGHRLSEWCGHAPVLEEELALGNLALDFLGQANELLESAGRLEGKGRTADALAFFRDVTDFRNCLLVEQPNGDFAHTMGRQFLFDAFDIHFTAALEGSSHPELAAFGARAQNAAAFHWRHSSEWVLRLGDGTEESRDRMQRAIDELWRYSEELFECDAMLSRLVDAQIAADPRALREKWRESVGKILKQAGLTVPGGDQWMQSGGRSGLHSESLGRMLSEMQSVARAFPGASW